MKMIYNIAKAELQMLFFSPVAWLLLIIFTVQCSITLTDIYNGFLIQSEMGYGLYDLSMESFSGRTGLLSRMQGNLYFYIPLLTMGLVSRELGSGSIRLLYSSPITNFHIILGKYLSMMAYGAIMMGILMIFVVFGQFTIKDFELSAILTGVLGLYLLICAYAAIGIFMSSLTSYQIVAALGTLAVFMGLSSMGRYGQNYDFVRDITWWLSMSGRVGEFISGLICSEDVLYFLIIIVLFISLTIIRLNAVRQKTRFSVTLSKNVFVIVLACTLGYLSSRPSLMSYYDSTHTKRNTLTPNSQDIISKMDGPATITTYSNLLGKNAALVTPGGINIDKDRFKRYLRFKPELKLKYVYYYDSTENRMLDYRYPDLNSRQRMVEVAKLFKIDTNKVKSSEEMGPFIEELRKEENHFVRQITRTSGQKNWLRIFNDMQRWPSEAEITASIKRLVMDLPIVGFFQGHNARSYIDQKDRSYSMFGSTKSYRQALINQGFDVSDVPLDKKVPDRVNILVIADLYEYFTPEEEKNLQQYIDRGGNLFILGEPRRRHVMHPLFNKFGFEMEEGFLVRDDSIRLPDLLACYPTPEADEIAYQFEAMRLRRLLLGTPSVGGLNQIADLGYKVTPLFRTEPDVWNELENRYFTDEDTIVYNPSIGEVMKTYTTVVALSRQVGDREQKIILSGDADCISNTMGDSRIRGTQNYSMITGGFFWMSDYETPIDVRRPPLPDDKLYITLGGLKVMKGILIYIIPILLAALGIGIWLRRRGR